MLIQAQTTPTLAERPVTTLKGVGPRLAERLQKLNITTLQDLLFHLPLRYEDRTQLTPIRQLRVGQSAVVEGQIVSAEIAQGRRQSLLCQISDGVRSLTLRFFYFGAYQQRQLARLGLTLRCYAEVRWGPNGIEMVHPEYQRIDPQHPQPLAQTLTPIYPTTEGVSQACLQKLITQAFIKLKDQPDTLAEYLPEPMRARFALADLAQALEYCHQPPRQAEQAVLAMGCHPMQQRLAFEELLAQQLSLKRLRARIKQDQAVALVVNTSAQSHARQFCAQLPFTLTAAQQRVHQEISQNLTQPHPMLRLVQGDVGSGKTVVAALAALQAVENGWQVAIMAPTEILAEQHYHNFSAWFKPLGLEVVWLVSKLTPKTKREAQTAIASGKAQVVIGTHALFQASVEFARLALVVIDEQHRFGVHQRLALKQKGAHPGVSPHQLIMTATPIPRTLTMTAYADLDVSIIDELPPGRKPVTTVAISQQRREAVIARVHQVCQQKGQVYWVCTLIEESELLQAQAAQATHAALQTALQPLRIGLVHGRLKPAEKATVMAAFKAGAIDVLVATTVIEVGVDVPNASLMIIENPERLGLAQLHQLRGRIGRGTAASHCVLLYQPPLSHNAKTRLRVMRETGDGFVIAKHDLELRGPGEVLGTKQTGLLNLKIADILRDKALLPDVRQAATVLLQDHPEVIEPIIQRWLADREAYGGIY